jgi:ABC-2 type transport system ATP-binding protein
MQQRLAIAQAMLGLPDVLVLDEPTNGLDPPQIAEMREVLHRYAATGRTVIVSSHLLAEVEQTCSHVVVMHRGRLVAAGSVAEVAGSGGVQLVVDDPARAANVLAASGISARTVPARRALEDVFLDLIGERHD